MDDQQRCGYVALVGRPNVGKSTLLNRILDYPLSITADKPQTTRHRILGIHTVDNTQLLFIDTPGLHESRRNALNRVLNRTAYAALEDVDCVAVLIEAPRITSEDELLLEKICSGDREVLLVLNKIDRTSREALLTLLERLGKLAPGAEIVPVSARSGTNVERLVEVLSERMPQRAFEFDADQLSDRNERFFIAELVREQLTRALAQELPYELTVETERFTEHEDRVEIDVLIWVERDSQKGIVVGRQGETLKRVGTRARQKMSRMLGKRVHLSTWVKVKKGWVDDERALRSLGYDG